MARLRRQAQGLVKARWLSVVFLACAIIESRSVTSAQPLGLSYACGAPRGFNSTNGISWASDFPVAPGGQPFTTQNSNLRIFSLFDGSNPQQNTNCYYKINQTFSGGGPILLRVTYKYQNYDNLNTPPQFDMWVGTTKVATIDLSLRDPWIEEVIYTKQGPQDLRALCVVALAGAPVISNIELRPLPVSSYQAANDTTLLRQIYRLDCGNGNTSVRYPDDPFDRVWGVDQFVPARTVAFASNATLDGAQVPDIPPLVVLQTSRILENGTSLSYNLPVEAAGSYEVKLYFAGLQNPRNRTTFNVSINGNARGVLTLNGLSVQEGQYLLIPISAISIDLQQSVNQPEVNALEVFQLISTGREASASDVNGLKDIASYYGINQLDWQGDPCLPTPWQNVNCTNSVVTYLDLSNQNLVQFSEYFTELSELIYLNLSNNRLNSEIPDFSGLSALQVLDLHNNDLEGTLDPLTVLAASLTELFVSNNARLSGMLPSSLNHSGLLVDFQGTCIGTDVCLAKTLAPESSPAPESSKKKSGHIAPIVGGIVGALLIALVAFGFLYFCWHRTRAQPKAVLSREKGHESQTLDNDVKNWTAAKNYTYKELVKATNNFKQRLGQGCFGPVYLGKLTNGQQIAVKMRSDDTQLGADAFKNEVYLLSRVHHPNLVSLLGYCQEGQHQLLVYEYMAGGTLSDHLYGGSTCLNWINRLRIAVGSATGIAFLHNESDPKIIHRDVKSNNILLDKNMVAKVSDFGLSKLVIGQETHVTTMVKGTAGYLDPEYYTTQQLTEKSDVYSFGVVLLEIISGREPLNGDRGPDAYNLMTWAKPYLSSAEYSAIVDPTIKDTYNPKTLNKVCGLLGRCIEKRAANRPSMLQVLRELEEALTLEPRWPEITSLNSHTNDNL